MLVELRIRDFALIDECEIELGPGLNVLTGETGAGKSIIIDGVAAIVGGRVYADEVRQGAEAALIEAAFDVQRAPRVRQEVEAMGMPEDELLIVTREIAKEGRSKCRINGRLANRTHLAQIGEDLVDIHGQHDHQSLLVAVRHVDLLDSLAGDEAQALRREVEALVERRSAIQAELVRLQGMDRDRAQREDLLRYQIAEIEEAQLEEGEEEHLNAERLRLAHAERIAAGVMGAYEALYGSQHGETPGAHGALSTALERLQEAVSFDEGLQDALTAVEGALAVVQDVALDLRRYGDGVEADPGRLDEVTQRLEVIARLKRKYGDSVADILRFKREAEEELARLEGSDQHVDALGEQLQHVEKSLAEKALQLSQVRRETAAKVEGAIAERLSKLQMPQARFVVSMRRRPSDDGVFVEGERVHVDRRGIDDVEFLFSANPGQEVRPLARIASGGEMSRVMLAIKGTLAEIDPVGTLIFDEVDTGLGGRAAESVADALAELASSHQVLVVTHLAQIAARADRHIAVSKVSSDDDTKVQVRVLEGEERVRELARMLDGKETLTGLEHARTLLQMARKGKAAS